MIDDDSHLSNNLKYLIIIINNLLYSTYTYTVLHSPKTAQTHSIFYLIFTYLPSHPPSPSNSFFILVLPSHLSPMGSTPSKGKSQPNSVYPPTQSPQTPTQTDSTDHSQPSVDALVPQSPPPIASVPPPEPQPEQPPANPIGEIPGKKQVEVIKTFNPENYEDDTNQTGLSHHEMRIQDSFFSAPNRPRSKAYTAARDADHAKRAAKKEKKATRKNKRRNKGQDAEGELVPNTVAWAIANTKRLGILNLSKLHLQSVPPEVFDSLPGTARIINVSFNQISVLDDRICDYVLVQRLIANGNLLTSIPPNIVRMTALKKLDLAHNKLTQLPDAFEGMRFLEHVDLSHNLLEQLPPSFASLQLTALNLSHNKLTLAPLQVASMEWLMDLDLSGNQLTSVPSEYMSLTQLIALNLESNKVSDFPNALLQYCTELVTLRLRDNPITMPVLVAMQSYPTFCDRRRLKLKRQIDSGAISEADLYPADN